MTRVNGWSCDRMVNRRRGALAAALTAAVAVAAAILATPGQAAACPSTSASSLSFQGKGTIAFKGAASGADQSGGHVSVSLDDTMGAEFGSVDQVKGTHGVDYQGHATNGAFAIDDAYSDTNSSGNSSGTQTESKGLGGLAGIVLNSPGFRLFGRCMYQVSIRLEAETKTHGTGNATGPPQRLSIVATSGLRPIPANLRLKGTATVDAYCTAPTGIGAVKLLRSGAYLLDGAENGYEGAFCGARSSSGATRGQPVGKAIVSWSFRPSS